MKLLLAPIDGYTDCAFREIVKKYGNPDMMFTEFVNAQGLIRATDKLIHILRYTENQRPIVAQLFGKDPEYFYKAALLVCYLGFDGIDINMGCPAKNIASKGGGVALIKKPRLTLEIVEAVKRAVSEYKNGKSTICNLQLVKNVIEDWKLKIVDSRKITVSVKTRTGYDKDITEEWIKTLSKAELDFITLHGRTLKQGYKGKADWGAIKRAVEVTNIPIIGNGDVKSYEEAAKRQEETGCWGVMIGRGSFGNPLVFKSSKLKTQNSKIKEIALEHAKLFVKYNGEKRFYEMRKHLMAYFKGFKRAKELRIKLSQVNSLKEVKEILS